MNTALTITRLTGSLLGLPLLLVSCSANPTPGQGQTQEGELDVRPLFTESYSGIESRLRTVVKDPDRWHELWTRIHARRTPVPPIPTIDFEDEMVVVAAMGRRGTGGYSISIDRVYREDESLVAVVIETAPGPGCMVTQALTAPITIVKLPRSDQPLRFVEERRTQDCG